MALGDLIDNFRNVVLSKLDLADIFQQVFRLLREFRLALPPDLALVLRTLLIAEGFVRRLDPAFNIADELAPIARELIAERTSLARLQSEAKKFGVALLKAASTAPDLVKQIEKIARTGTIQIKLSDEDRKAILGVSRSREPIDIELLSASLLVCSAILAGSHPSIAILAVAISVTLFFWTLSSRQ